MVKTTSSSKLRVGVISNALGLGGAETQLLRLCKHIDPSIVQIEVIYYAKPHTLLKEFQAASTRITFIDRDSIGKVKFIWTLSRYLRSREFDVIHCWRGTANQYGALAAIIAGCRCILTGYRNITPFPWPIKVFDRLVTGFTVGQVVNSYAVKNFQREFLKCPEHKIAVLYNGIDVTEFKKDFDVEETRKSVGISIHTPFVVSIGRLVYHKRHELLIEAASLLKAKGYTLEYGIIGEGIHREALQKMAQKYGLQNEIHFLGARRDIVRILAASDISVCCSISEGLPNAVLESMMAGATVITTDNGGGSELIRRKEQIISVDDVNALANKLAYLIDNKEVRLQWAKQAQERAFQEFSIDAATLRYVEILKDAFYNRRNT